MGAMRRLPLLYRCDRRWADMDGDGVVRRCHDCERDVVNLSALDEATAATLLREQSVTACVRYDCAPGSTIKFARRAGTLAVAAAAAVLLAAPVAGADTATPGPLPGPAHTPSPRKHKRADDKKRTPKKAQPQPDPDEYGGIIEPKF
jgi:hypothetical protein